MFIIFNKKVHYLFFFWAPGEFNFVKIPVEDVKIICFVGAFVVLIALSMYLAKKYV